MHNTYDHLRNSLFELMARFERAANCLPPLFHQWIFAPKDPLSDESWNGFINKYADQSGHIWELWELSESGVACGRWSGEEGWYDEFTFLGESGYLTLEAIKNLESNRKPDGCVTELPELSGHEGWLELLYRTSQISAPLLRLKGDYWQIPNEADDEEKERLLYESWSKSELTDDDFPNHPTYLTLGQTVFAASVEAIRIWLNDNDVASVDVIIDDSPVALPEFATTNSEHPSFESAVSLSGQKPSFQNRKLMLGNVLIRHYTQPSRDSKDYPSNQERVLLAFEEEAWPDRVDDPLPPPKDGGIDMDRRRTETTRSINKKMKAHLIKFRVDGDGFSWDLVR